jgi:hypothetical protein
VQIEPLSNFDIDDLLRGNQHFLGVYSRDSKLPDLITDSFIVMNLDSVNNPGTHWVSLYKKNTYEYMDSFGLPAPSELDSLDIIFSNDQIQHPLSNSCGYYAIYYPLLRIAGNTQSQSIELLKHME